VELPIRRRLGFTLPVLNEVRKRLADSQEFESLRRWVDRLFPLVAGKAPNYFRTNTQVFQAMADLQTKYPDLVKVEDVGDSGDKRAGKGGYDIMSMRLGSPKAGQPRKPILMVIATEHAREIANAEISMRKATQLLEGYGKDPEATALLDNYELVFIPIVNPDGHAVVEQGFATGNSTKLMQRKNTQGPGDGVDPNRNYPFHYGGAGASTNPYSQTYRGKGPASESEIQAVIGVAEAINPDFFISLHSYSELVLYAWGDTKEKSPDHVAYKSFSDAMSSLTDEGGDKYTSQPGIDLYATTGTSSDHMYGALHIPAVTIETGQSFHQSDSEFEQTWNEVGPVLDYAAKLTNGAWALGMGPMVRSVKVEGTQVTAQVSDAYNGNQAIVAAEAVTDLATPYGQGVPLSATDGSFDGSQEVVKGDIAALKGKLVYVRAKDADGNWGTWGADWNAAPKVGNA
jgi:carboxypeptidase T